MRWREEMQSQKARGIVQFGGDLVNVEVGGIGRQDRRLGQRVLQLGKDRVLDRHILEHRLDGQVGPRRLRVVVCRGEPLAQHLGARL